ncbi:hypothetical protein DVS77_22750 [Mycolicibacterium moriokaense]|nr:hypothetical protein DVS77_22750 [Mycolicibacterium moriokaense]
MNVRLVTLSLAAAAAAVAIAAPAAASPSSPNAADVVTKLQKSGNTVIVNRTGSHPLSECMVTGVRAGQTYIRFDSGYPGGQMDPMNQVVGMTVYVDTAC